MKIQVWLAMDRETRRVCVQNREFDDGNFPGGLRSLDWPRRTTEVSKATFTKLMRGKFSPDAQDTIHRRWWDQAAGPKDPPWPHLKGEK